MKSSSIYNIISNPARRSDCSFGASDGFSQDIRVGTSSSNSHTLADISVQHHIDDNGNKVFCLFVDGTLIKRGTLTGQDFEFNLNHVK